MKTRNTSTASFRTLVMAGVLFSISQWVSVPSARAAERQFLVMLAHSPKQFAGGPAAQLASQEAIRKQYFDNSDPTIDSFAEFWEEISYGDVIISGDVTDWINIPWRIEIDPDMASAIDGGIAYFDLNIDGVYSYGRAERFDTFFAQALGDGVTGDLNGDPGGNVDGPNGPAPGSRHTTSNGFSSVWKPGERFIDMDEDGAWDALDEVNNLMDFFDGNGELIPDGKPDLEGPWIDLSLDGALENKSNTCVYLADDDNSSDPDRTNTVVGYRDEPNCCPNGPATTGCERYNVAAGFGGGIVPGGHLTEACPATKWETPGGEFLDCNGNLIPDVCDINPAAAGCVALGWTMFPNVFPRVPSQDTSPLTRDGGNNLQPAPDGIPDECQHANWAAVSVVPPGGAPSFNGCTEPGEGADCVDVLDPLRINPPDRCEFDDSNGDDEIDMVEPWENFLRRWNPCISDIDANPINRFEDQTHWIKVYDPNSINKSAIQTCDEPPESFSYGDPSYIRNNYPAKQADIDELVRQAEDDPNRILWGSHDPDDLLPVPTSSTPPPVIQSACEMWLMLNFNCLCDPPDSELPRPCGVAGDSYLANICLAPNRETALGIPLTDFPCETDTSTGCDATKVIPNYCFIGYHHQFDPPDSWTNMTPVDGDVPQGQIFSAKMQVEAGFPCNPLSPVFGGCEAGALVGVRTAEPGTGPSPRDRPWFDQFWGERYSRSGNPPPPWDGGTPGIPRVRVFPDADAGTYNAPANRRYFAANKGGRSGDGFGWKEGTCGVFSAGVSFETGNLPDGFATVCDAPILPEEINGASEVGEFFDGYVEYDDLPSSKYHRAGDQRLGEVTSPAVGNVSIFGQDRGPHIAGALPVPDTRIAAAGPLAVNIHGNGSFDAGNQLNIELLTWRNQPPFNDGRVWERELLFDGQGRFHPYAIPSGADKGFRDYNLDGLVDLGESRYEGTENYTADAVQGPNDGVGSKYPWHRSRIIEDVVEVNDRLLDFDDFVDVASLDAVSCIRGGSSPSMARPTQYGAGTIVPDGLTSGIVLLPPNAHDPTILRTSPRWLPIHNNDNDNPNKSMGTGAEKINWNIFFHTLVRSIDSNSFFETSASGQFLVRFSAHEYGHAWQGFPDLYDYDVFSDPPLENAPIGRWDLMANGTMVHMVPILKEGPCTAWIEPVDLTTVLTPGVDATITIPPYETVRDRNAYFLENPAVPGERYYFYSVGILGVDAADAPNGGMPGDGMLVLHTDVGGNPDALPSGQQNETRINYLIVQADGVGSLESPVGAPDFNRGDPTDAWPGPAARGDPAHKTRFNFDTFPAATWYTQNAWTGLDVLDIVPDGAGSILLTVNWQPTNISSLKFTSPPGGASVGDDFTVGFDATDVHGGTTIELYYTTDPTDITILPNDGTPGSGNLIGSMAKVNPGTRRMSMNWNISVVPDGTYFIFAKLIPGQGGDGVEVDHTVPIPGRNNESNGTLTINNVEVLRSKARSETWSLRLVDVQPNGTQDWIVNATLTQPVPADQDPNQDPYPHLFVDPITHKGQYVSIGEEVTFTLESEFPVALGDRWSFTTTGITAHSRSLTILAGEVDEDPRAQIFAFPLAGDPPLTVFFDAINSTDPNGTPLEFTWDFGDGAVGVGESPSHVFERAGTFTVTLTATSATTGRFGAAQVDIAATNNSPKARMSASPNSGLAPLLVQFSATASSDAETLPVDLVYQWDFGDGTTANAAGMPGLLFADTEHAFIRDAEGVLCQPSHLCTFHPKLTVTDEGGKQDVIMDVSILVGNTTPEAIISNSRLEGGDPHTVIFNAKDSVDADGDVLTVTWIWGDGSPDESFAAVTGKDELGNVPHTYTLRTGETTSDYVMAATVTDGNSEVESRATVRVSEAFVDSSQPHADFTITPNPPVLGERFEVDASNSFDRPNPDTALTKFEWDWGDGTPNGTEKNATHTYTTEGSVTITLIVTDNENNHGTARKTFSVGQAGGDGSANGIPTARLVVVSPQNGEGFAGDPFVFSGATSSDPDGDPLTYRWTFGLDGTPPQTGSEISHIFEVAGEFFVMLTVTDSSGASEDATVLVVVNPRNDPNAPVPIIGTGPRSGAAPLTLTFNGQNSFDPNGDPITYRWDFFMGQDPDPAVDTPFDSANGAIVSQLFADEGVFSVILVVEDGQGAPVFSSPEIVTVTARVTDTEPGQPTPNPDPGTGTPPSSPRFCGFGMLLGLCGSMFGLTIMRLTRRRTARRRRITGRAA